MPALEKKPHGEISDRAPILDKYFSQAGPGRRRGHGQPALRAWQRPVTTATASGASRPLGKYIDRDGERREVVSYHGADRSTLVIDQQPGTRADQRLVAHLAADEPIENARTVACVYLADDRHPRCRHLTRDDIEVAPATELQPEPADERGGVTDVGEDDLIDKHGRVYRLQLAVLAGMKAPQARWHSYPPAGHEGPPATVTVRSVIGALENYEPACTLTRNYLAAHEEDREVSTSALRSDLRRVSSSRIVLNRGLREAAAHVVASQGISYSEIATRCGRVKRDVHGCVSGHTSWLARRMGAKPEGGEITASPWVHSDVLALIARQGLVISPREAEL
jgi:hypothetical protein